MRQQPLRARPHLASCPPGQLRFHNTCYTPSADFFVKLLLGDIREKNRMPLYIE